MNLYNKVFAFVVYCSIPVFSQAAAVPGGSFIMGGADGEADEKPPHTVTLPAMTIDAYEVSNALYDSCVKQGACTQPHYDDGKCIIWSSSGIRKVVVPPDSRSPSLPVVCVDWYQARQYCAFRGKRLPTEAQWEYAALAGGQNSYTWGAAPPTPAQCTPASANKPAQPGSYSPNRWGLFDMTGNVWEWTADWYGFDYYTMSELENPSGPPVGRYRVIRGGGWYSDEEQLKIKNRQLFPPEYGEVSVGIRCVK